MSEMNIVRREDGSIDMDFYRARARSMRRQAMQDQRASRMIFAIAPLLAAAAIGIAFLAQGGAFRLDRTANVMARAEQANQPPAAPIVMRGR